MVLPAAIYPFHNDHCPGRCTSAILSFGHADEAVRPPPSIATEPLQQSSSPLAAIRSLPAVARSVLTVVRSVPSDVRSSPRLSARASPQRDIPTMNVCSGMPRFGRRILRMTVDRKVAAGCRPGRGVEETDQDDMIKDREEPPLRCTMKKAIYTERG